jgi:hypothetical protein
MLLFAWMVSDGVTAGTFARTGTAAFVTFTPTNPPVYQAYDVSRPFVLARPADGGTTL